LYIRGFYDTAPTSSPTYGTTDYERGASIAFDIGNWGEYNHIKVSVPIHDLITYEAANMPADTGQASFATELLITPSLSDKLSPYQIREFRFRGGAYIPGAANKATGSLGVLSGLKTSSGAGEFDAYFTSPGMVGCDFLNIYSNAIFFSDTGDGKRTSFTEQGEDWLQSNDAYPSGIYFIPRDGATNPYFQFVDYDSTLATSNISTSFGYSHGFYYEGTGDIFLTTDGAVDIHSDSDIYIGTSTDSIYTLGFGSYLRMKTDGVSLYMGSTTTGDLTIAKGTGSTGDVVISNSAAGGDVNITSVDDVNITSTDSVNLLTTSGNVNLVGIAWNQYFYFKTDGFQIWKDSDDYIRSYFYSADQFWIKRETAEEYSKYINIGWGTESTNAVTTGIQIRGNTSIKLEANSNYLSIGNTSVLNSNGFISLSSGDYVYLNGINGYFLQCSTLSVPTASPSGAYKYLLINSSTGQIHRTA
jgi:hypothetical protein